MTIKRHWTDTIAMGIAFEDHRSKPLSVAHSEKFKRIAINSESGSRTETEHELRVIDPDRVEEDTIDFDEASGEIVVVDSQKFEGKEQIERRFGIDGDILLSHQPMVAYGEGPFYLSHEPALPPQAKK